MLDEEVVELGTDLLRPGVTFDSESRRGWMFWRDIFRPSSWRRHRVILCRDADRLRERTEDWDVFEDQNKKTASQGKCPVYWIRTKEGIHEATGEYCSR